MSPFYTLGISGAALIVGLGMTVCRASLGVGDLITDPAVPYATMASPSLETHP